MRRLSMRNKRKSEATSEDESEENGVNNSGTTGKNNKTSTARKSDTKRRSASRNATDDNAEAKNLSDEPEKERENGQKASSSQKSSPNKRKKKEDMAASTSSRDKSSSADEDEYEVEKLVHLRTIKGRRQFLVRWKGYGESADSWENEKDLNCPALIQKYLEEEKEKELESENISSPKTSKTKKSKSTSKKNTEDGEEKDSENAKEFEVEKIIEVRFRKNGSRDFLIRWKGFSPAHDSWEPESNLNCPYLISRFMEKLELVKTTDMRELRTNRVHTKRYTLSTHDAGRRLSKRNRDKQRATYHECDE